VDEDAISTQIYICASCTHRESDGLRARVMIINLQI
jgi:hypothetical protein